MRKSGLTYILSFFSANALQIGFSQLGGLFLFWLSSKELSKEDFGDFSWYFAVYGTIFSVFSFGLDFIVIKRISAKNDINAVRAQFMQTIIVSCIALLPVLFIIYSKLFSTEFKSTLFILVAFQFTYLSMPFKNALTGKELFKKSAQPVIIANLIKIGLVFYLYAMQAITLVNVSLLLAICNFIELLFYLLNAYSIFDKKVFDLKINFNFYRELIRESLPQLGVIIFDSAFARIDWILLGLLSVTSAAVNIAEYSVAYKIFELSRLPLLILAPILFTRLSKLFHSPQNITKEIESGIHSFFKLELFVGMIIPLILNIVWVPVMLFFTSNKYGVENQLIYFLLSLTLPIIYMINFLWAIAFTQGQLKLTMILSVINSCLNILLNVLLIPKYGQTGAALSFLICNVVMLPLYLYFVNQTFLKFPIKQGLIILTLTLAIGCICHIIPFSYIGKCTVCVLLYCGILFYFKIVTISELKKILYY
jgi:O-antigen/teichoic acid export membrane protein